MMECFEINYVMIFNNFFNFRKSNNFGMIKKEINSLYVSVKHTSNCINIYHIHALLCIHIAAIMVLQFTTNHTESLPNEVKIFLIATKL